jgi:urate oxidase
LDCTLEGTWISFALQYGATIDDAIKAASPKQGSPSRQQSLAGMKIREALYGSYTRSEAKAAAMQAATTDRSSNFAPTSSEKTFRLVRDNSYGDAIITDTSITQLWGFRKGSTESSQSLYQRSCQQVYALE